MREKQSNEQQEAKAEYVRPAISVYRLQYESSLLTLSGKGTHQGAGNGSGSAANTSGSTGGGAGEAEDLTEIGNGKRWSEFWEDEDL